LTQVCFVYLRQIRHSFVDLLTQQSSLSSQNTKCQLVLLTVSHLPDGEQREGGTHKSDAERDHPILCKNRQDLLSYLRITLSGRKLRQIVWIPQCGQILLSTYGALIQTMAGALIQTTATDDADA